MKVINVYGLDQSRKEGPEGEKGENEKKDIPKTRWANNQLELSFGGMQYESQDL